MTGGTPFGMGTWYGPKNLEEWLIIYRVRGAWKTNLFFGTKAEAKREAHNCVITSSGWVFKDIIKKEDFIEWKKKEHQKFVDRKKESKKNNEFKNILTTDIARRMRSIPEERVCIKCGNKFLVKGKNLRQLCADCSEYGDHGIIKENE
jgi:hypothetical protein